MAVIKDIVEGNLQESSTGFEIERAFIVTSIKGNADAKQYNARIAAGVPQQDDPHPTIPDISVIGATVDAIDVETFSVRVQYGKPVNSEGSSTIDVSSSLQSIKTQKDKDDVEILVFHPETTELFIDGADNTDLIQTAEIDVQVPVNSIRITKTESANPVAKMLTYQGTINQLDIGLFKAQTLLCAGVEFEKTADAKYNVTYLFEYNPKKWVVFALFIDDTTNRPHSKIDIENGKGFSVAYPYIETDFNGLGITQELTFL